MDELFQLALIWAGVLLSCFLAERTKLTPVLYFLAVGAVAVNLGLLPVESSGFLRGFAQIGIILIMFALGFEENSSNFVRSIRRSWGIALFGAIAPFMAAYYSSLWFWGDPKLSLMCGLAMTATAVSLTMVSLRSEGLHTSRAATGIMTSAVLDDIASLVLVAILVPLATGSSAMSLQAISLIILKAMAFFSVITVLGMWIFPNDVQSRVLGLFPRVRRYGIRDLLFMCGAEKITLVILLLALVIGLLAWEFGFHPAVGAYMAGLVLKDEYFRIHRQSDASHYREIKKIVDDVAFYWIGPVFFVELGTKLVFDAGIFFSVIEETAILTAALFFSQILSAGLAARYTGHFDWRESVMIGFGMLGRAELAFVVMDIGYIEHAILSTEAFYTLMFTAFFLNIAVPVSIRLWKPYFVGEKPMPF